MSTPERVDRWLRFENWRQPEDTPEAIYLEHGPRAWVQDVGYPSVRARLRLEPADPRDELVTYGQVRRTGYGLPEAVYLWMDRAPHWHPVHVQIGPVAFASTGTLRATTMAAAALDGTRAGLLALLEERTGRKLGAYPMEADE